MLPLYLKVPIGRSAVAESDKGGESERGRQRTSADAEESE
jgi:hypothetical protein